VAPDYTCGVGGYVFTGIGMTKTPEQLAADLLMGLTLKLLDAICIVTLLILSAMALTIRCTPLNRGSAND
jgi:hypothetical protein